VTGGSRGLGRADCLALARAGADVVVTDILIESDPELEKTAEASQSVLSQAMASQKAVYSEKTSSEIREMGRRSVALKMDVTNRDQVKAVVDQVVGEFGSLDILVNNAGMAMAAESIELSAANWQRTIDLDLSAVFYCAQAAGRHMLARGAGAIVNISSIQAFTPLARRVAYAASKAGVIGVTKALAVEWAPAVRVNAVAPGYVATQMVEELVLSGRVNAEAIAARTPMRRMAQPEEIAAAVVFLSSDAAGYITGETLMVDGGWSSWAAI